MSDKFYAVIDTNVIVSAVISRHLESNPVKIIRAIVQERIIPYPYEFPIQMSMVEK